MNVETILRGKGREVEMVAPDHEIAHAVARLAERRIGALVVSEDGKQLAGILSERDIVRALAAHGAKALTMSVAALMTRDVFACELEDKLEELASKMTERRIRHLPVLEAGAICGIISIGDVVKNRLDEVEYEASSLRSFIAGA
jgi:CBS domain-containing protein